MTTTKDQSTRSKSLEKSTDMILSNNLWLKILIGMGLGVALGLVLSPENYDLLEKTGLSSYIAATTFGEWISLPGIIFLGLIQMVIVPLILCSIILGIAENGNMSTVKKLSARIVPYFLFTTAMSVTIGILLVSIIQPGNAIDTSVTDQIKATTEAAASTAPAATFENLTIPQRVGNMIPKNPAKAQVDRNMLQIVIAAIIVGIALLSIPAKSGKPLLDLCKTGQILSMRIISWAMMIAPLAVFGLLCDVTIKMGLSAIGSLGIYVFTVLLGLCCMMAVYLLIIRLVTGRPVLSFLSGIREAQLIAFSTSSSAATMPISIQAAEEKLKIKPEVSRFVVPLGATINMDGTAMYQAIAAIFLCQVFGIDLSTEQTIILLLTTIGASIGTPATPGVGIVVLATILLGIGVPTEGIALILGVDRILDMCRTTVNVTGDLTASAVMHKWMGYKTAAKKEDT
jgi:proton glutamate symport protein